MKLHKIYTGGGDDGTTCIPDGSGEFLFSGRGHKSSLLIKTNQFINLFNVKLGYTYGFGFDSWIEEIQNNLVIIMGEIICSSNQGLIQKYHKEYGCFDLEKLDKAKEFLKLVESFDVSIVGWVKYNNKKSLCFYEVCEYCRLAEIYISECHLEGLYVSNGILSYFNYLSKMLFMMGYMVDVCQDLIVKIENFKKNKEFSC